MSGAAFLTILHPGQAKELLAGPRLSRGFRRKKEPLSSRYIAGLLGALAVGLGLPYAEEILRCVRAALRRGVTHAAARIPAPPAPELAFANRPGDLGEPDPSTEQPSHAVD